MFNGDPRELGRRGAAARNQRLSPEARSRIASQAAYQRWYFRPGSGLARINWALKQLAEIVEQAQKAGEHAKALRALRAMLPFERLKIAWERHAAHQARMG